MCGNAQDDRGAATRMLTRLPLTREGRRVQQPGGCCSEDAVDTDGNDPYRGGRVNAVGIAFELFVTEILSRDPETELVSASLLDRAPYQTADYGTDFVVLRRGKILLVEAKAATPQTSRRLAEQSNQLQIAGRVYMEQHPGEPKPGLVLAFPGVLRQSKRAAAAQQSLEIWDGPYLRPGQNGSISLSRQVSRLAMRLASCPGATWQHG